MKALYILIFIFLLSSQSFSQSSWQWVNPKPDNLFVLDKSFANDMTGYILYDSDIIKKTTDGGSSWITIYHGNSNRFRRISSPEENTLFVIGNQNSFIKTTDGGISWNPVNVDTVEVHFYTIFFLNNYNGYVYGSAQTLPNNSNNIYKTTDGGLSWTNIFSNLNFHIEQIQFIDENTGYASKLPAPFRIYKTTNGGFNWTYYTFQYYSPLTMHFTDSETGYVATYNGLVKTTNGGMNFSLLNIGTIQNDTSVYNLFFFDQSTGFAISKYKIFRTTDSGLNWNAFDVSPFNTFENGENSKIYFNSTGSGSIFNRRGLVYNTTNFGETWTRFTTGFSSKVLLMDLLDSTKIFLFSEDDDDAPGKFRYIIKSSDKGINWNIDDISYIQDNDINKLQFLNYNNGFLNSYQRLYRTTNGSSWEENFYNSESIMSFDFVDFNTGYLLDDEARIYKTTNNGNNWNLLVTIQDIGWPFKIKFINNNTGFMCSTFYGLSKTTNGGLNWFRIYTNSDLTYHFIDQNNIYGFAGPALLKSINGGSNWQIHNLPLEYAIYSEVKNHICYIWGSVGYPNYKFFKSIDGGNAWTEFDIGISRPIDGIKFINENTGYIYSEYSGTILKTTNGGTTFINNISSNVPEGFRLYQNYPNPFNPSTKIKFEIPKSGKVELVIYDITGRKVQELLNENLSAGSYEMIFNASNLSSGIYFYVLKSFDHISSKKMIYLK
jgi:photosystem II stability/assembly factor-like uncharacterized protein